MSHILVEIPKEAPFKGCWVEIVAENWAKEDILYIPDNSYSPAHKRNMLNGGAEPVVGNWESYPCFNVIHRFDTYQEARHNLPRAEKGLPILPTDPSQTGRGFRQIILKSRKRPGTEVTTEQKSGVSLNDESFFATTSKSSLKTKTTASKGKGIAKRPAPGPSKSSLLPVPPSGLQTNKKKEKPHGQVDTVPKAVCSPRPQQMQTSSSTTCLVPAHTSSNKPSARSITDNDSNESCVDFNSDCIDMEQNSQEMNDEMACTGFPNDTQGIPNGNVLQLSSLDTQYLTAFIRDKAMFNKLVGLEDQETGEKKHQSSMGAVLSDSASKDLNWLSNEDKRKLSKKQRIARKLITRLRTKMLSETEDEVARKIQHMPIIYY